ncbi:MAG: chemotaxis protein CheB [Acidobacteriia bacterium]|nr:chemotaxis protein CheB [Terriglobia bacterium]
MQKILVAGRVGRQRNTTKVSAEPKTVTKGGPRVARQPNRVVALGVSTGGPNALQYVLSQIPADFPAALLVVQHMPEGFTEMLAKRLDDCCEIDVAEARSGDILLAGRALIAPGNRHMMARRMPRGDVTVLTDSAPVNGHRPSVDVLFHSVAQEFGPSSIAVLMTGMGEDGADGLGAVRNSGGTTIAQSEESCVVSGMPRAAILKGYASHVVHLEKIGAFLVSQCSGEREGTEQMERKSLAEKQEVKERTPVSSPRN